MKAIKNILILVLIFCTSFVANAQCAMCRAALETEEGGQKAEAVNNGIVYLMVIPYILVAIIGFFVYKTRKKRK